ncbi:hypothetical protein E3T28_05060 [Cryobacterium sinapicolor]|uniref:Hemagglutinin n=1 Tax=Cryobacterium sinapicolor TaxID=1259236 RepID=A0ABY2JC54_9MICO|nr:MULTISPECIES: hypothetical protein [Cryobacterium]TFC82917.1 hypothetical protein E3O67_15705 [Cryobacterium sp. TMT3-29-2]TFD02548.1 hypothetical protein E3T28_05060 [Cryobacterium sinapicolor]
MTDLGTPRRRMIALAMIVALALLGGGLALAASVQPTDEATAPARFEPGAIISDYNFYNADSMNENEIQSFLADRSCIPRDGSPCLADYAENTISQPPHGEGHCSAYPGGRNESAARIIAKVSEACLISPKVLLVLLQKEQSLLTRPSAAGYLRATGYGCPDTADCDTQYFGFFNQVYRAAWQFRQYTQEPERAYKIGTVRVAFNPDASCGATGVTIENQATANLYNYTPYQPNEAALDGPAFDGDGCSTHGNLNFWRFYNQWFGASEAVGYPAAFNSCLNLVGGQPCREHGLLPTP